MFLNRTPVAELIGVHFPNKVPAETFFGYLPELGRDGFGLPQHELATKHEADVESAKLADS
jgi:hypothetical protein